jgi:hypothetical protein
MIKTIEGLTDAVLGFRGVAEGCLFLNNSMLAFKVQKPGLSRSRCMGRGRSLIFKMKALLLGMAIRLQLFANSDIMLKRKNESAAWLKDLEVRMGNSYHLLFHLSCYRALMRDVNDKWCLVICTARHISEFSFLDLTVRVIVI